jgi:cytochrome c peroxidase
MSSGFSPRFRTTFVLGVLPVAAVLLAGFVLLRRSSTGSAPAGGPPSAPEAVHSPEAGSASSAFFLANSPIQPIPAKVDLDPRKVALGERLFHDAGLSKDGTISCASCHDISAGGDDGRRVSTGIGGAQGALNAPTVLNSAFNFRQFWDGRARSLEDQVDGPIQHPDEMGMQWSKVLDHLTGDPEYTRLFAQAYGGAPSQEWVKDAIATFERSLTTPGCAFDRHLLGDASALSAQARAGYELFLSLGCISCHQGVNTGGNMFQPLGKMGDFFAGREEEVRPSDLGRFNVTGEERDRFTFKVPSLRNVELTAPYFHDGSVATLEDAVQLMARFQLGEDLTAEEVGLIVAFLKALTGELPQGG